MSTLRVLGSRINLSQWIKIEAPVLGNFVHGHNRQSYQMSTEANTQSKTDVPKEEAQGSVEESAAYKSLIEEKEKLSKEIEDLKDKYVRSLAETENTRNRLQKQISDAKEFGIQGFCKDLLEVADILTTAVDSINQEDLKKESTSFKSLHEGVAMTQQQLRVVFSRHGVHLINPSVGEKFDPNLHEALFQAPAQDSCPPGSVAIVQKVGYTLKTRTLRPALVGVVPE